MEESIVGELWKNFEVNHGYKLIEFMGDSGNNKVYKAKKKSTGKHYVIKVIPNAFENV